MIEWEVLRGSAGLGLSGGAAGQLLQGKNKPTRPMQSTRGSLCSRQISGQSNKPDQGTPSPLDRAAYRAACLTSHKTKQATFGHITWQQHDATPAG